MTISVQGEATLVPIIAGRLENRRVLGGHIRLVRAFTTACFFSIVLTQSVAAFGYDSWNGHYALEPTNKECVAASALTWSNYISGATSYSASTVTSWFNEAHGTNSSNMHTRYWYGTSGGLDPRAWAWLVWKHNGNNQGFNDYKYASQGSANTMMVYGLRTTHKPVGAVVATGLHAIDVTGFSSSADPLDQPYTLNGFYVIDPWYPKADPSNLPSGPYGLYPHSYIAISTWNSNYFTKYNEPAFTSIWDNYYVAILRASTGAAPSDSPPPPYSQTVGTVTYEAVPAPDDADTTVGGALINGLARNRLLEPANELGVDLRGVEVGPSLRVQSLDPQFPSYWLAEVRHGSVTLAVAMITEDLAGFHFAAVRAAKEGYRLGTEAAVRSFVGQLGYAATGASPTWISSPQSDSPFSPLWRMTLAGGGQLYLTPSGSLVADPKTTDTTSADN